MEKRNYLNYLLMLGLSFLTMYSVMYANVDDISHIYFSINRFYMTILMVAPMAIIMMIFMRHMYKNKKLNGIITALSIVIFITAYIAKKPEFC